MVPAFGAGQPCLRDTMQPLMDQIQLGSEFRTELSKPWPVSQVPPTARFCK